MCATWLGLPEALRVAQKSNGNHNPATGWVQAAQTFHPPRSLSALSHLLANKGRDTKKKKQLVFLVSVLVHFQGRD